jgi:hypothetical protein
MLRNFLLTAAVIAPLALLPVDASAQARGMERSGTATAQAEAANGAANGQAVGRPAEAPSVIERIFEGLLRPFGLSNTRSEPEPEPTPPAETDEPCANTVVPHLGQLWVQDCDGNLLYPVGME